ncbi:hypothetical protein LEP1GSC082_2370 [Leptospira kirschneri str. H2]|uniref:Uncharacterized protein n=1 Tax=Leptospira kirschneri str. H1 TaxID=1049966 RepID=A0A0E2AYD4_9LEPT|nr:hypothetical protein LEP1GSC081_3134 [Leptospira kirschneri str. H1]EKO61410.1 hypothetical protein LEP1GSC082_2370 [Leptospira kirschneri str. H2]
MWQFPHFRKKPAGSDSIFFRKMNHGFLHELTLIYKFVGVPAN